LHLIALIVMLTSALPIPLSSTLIREATEAVFVRRRPGGGTAEAIDRRLIVRFDRCHRGPSPHQHCLRRGAFLLGQHTRDRGLLWLGMDPAGSVGMHLRSCVPSTDAAL
jgi:hypothetical protein